MEIINCEQQSKEWFDLRLGKLTASEAQAIATAGKGLETLCYEKAAELLTGKKNKEPFSNGDTDRGNQLEEEAASLYEFETGRKVRKVGFCLLNEFVGCSPDRFVEDDGMAEIKCPDDVNYLKFLLDKEIKAAYIWQMQMQMFIADKKWNDHIVYNPNFANNPIQIIRVTPDEVKITKIRVGLEIGTKKIKEILESVKL